MPSPFFLRALKGTEQAVLEERRAHPAAIVRDRENDAASDLLRADVNAASRPERIARVEHQVGHDALDLFAVSQHPGQRL